MNKNEYPKLKEYKIIGKNEMNGQIAINLSEDTNIWVKPISPELNPEFKAVFFNEENQTLYIYDRHVQMH